MTDNAKTNSGSNLMKSGYEGSVKARAIARAGNNPNIHGHIFEIMASDKTNLNPCNGLTETLTKNVNAKTVDTVVRSGGKIVGRTNTRMSRTSGELLKR